MELERHIEDYVRPEEILAGVLWNIREGYSVADKEAVGKGPFEWISPSDTHPDDVRDRKMYLEHAAAAILQLRLAGWEFRQVDPPHIRG